MLAFKKTKVDQTENYWIVQCYFYDGGSIVRIIAVASVVQPKCVFGLWAGRVTSI